MRNVESITLPPRGKTTPILIKVDARSRLFGAFVSIGVLVRKVESVTLPPFGSETPTLIRVEARGLFSIFFISAGVVVRNVESVTFPPFGSTTQILIRVEARGRVLISLSILSLKSLELPLSSMPIPNKPVLTSPSKPPTALSSTGILSDSRSPISFSSLGVGNLGSSFSSTYESSTAASLPSFSSFDPARVRPCRMAVENRGIVPAKKGPSATAEAQMMATVDSKGVQIPPLDVRFAAENPMRKNLMTEMSISLGVRVRPPVWDNATSEFGTNSDPTPKEKTTMILALRSISRLLILEIGMMQIARLVMTFPMPLGQNKTVCDKQVPFSFQNAETGAQWKTVRITCIEALQTTSAVPYQHALAVFP